MRAMRACPSSMARTANELTRRRALNTVHSALWLLSVLAAAQRLPYPSLLLCGPRLCGLAGTACLRAAQHLRARYRLATQDCTSHPTPRTT